MAINQIDWIKTSDNKEYETRGFYFIEGTGTTAGKWLGSHIGIKEYYDGLTIAYKIPVAGSSTTTLDINNLGAKTVYRNASSKITTHYPVNTVVILTYISTGSYPGWHRADYDTTDTQSLRTYYTRYYAAQDLYRYKICGINKYGQLEPLTLTNQTSSTIVNKTVNTTPIRPNEFYYYNSTATVAKNSLAANGTLYFAIAATNLQYTINSTGTTYKEIYLVGTYDQTTGLFTLDSTNSTSWYVLVPYNEEYNLSDYFNTNKNYILLGRTYSSNNYFYLYPNHTTYKFDGQSLIEISTCTETKQKYSLENAYKPLLMSDEFTNTDSSGEIVGDVAWNNKIYANPSTGYVHASGVKSNGDVLNIESNDELQLRGPSYLVAYSNFVDIFTDGESNKIRIDSNDLRINASRNNASTVIGYEGSSGATGNIKLNATTVEILAGQNTYTIDNDGITATGHTELGNATNPFDHYINSIKAKTASNETTYGQGSAGQVLTSNGSQVYWSTPSNFTDGYWANIKVSDTSSTTTSPTFANINSLSDSAIHKIATGTNASSYFQSRKFRGEGEADSYYHSIDFGYSGHNQVDFYEWGGLWNFWQNQSSTATTSEGNLALQIGLSALKNKSYTYSWPNKTGTFALTSDIPTKTSQLTNDSNFVAAEDGKIPSSYLPAYVDDVLEYNNKSAFPTTGESGVIYIDKATNLTYRWSGTAYVEISPSIALGETASTAYPGNKGKANADAITSIQTTLNGLDSKFVSGASSSTDNAIVRWDGTTGKTVQNSKVTIDDSGTITIGGTWTDTSANNPGLSMGGYAKLTANTAGAFTLSPSNTATYLATATEFRPISSKDGAIDLGSSTYYWRNVYANNFIKRNSSDDYILLGGGGQKALSDFAMSSEILDPTKYYWANINISKTSSDTTFPRFKSARAGNTVYNIAKFNTTTTPVETVLHTGIKWASGSYMPIIHLTGYAYGLQSPVEFKIGFYIYNNNIGWCGVTNMGAWKPEVYLFKDTRDGVDYVAVGLKGACYFLMLEANLQENMRNIPSSISLDPSLWYFTSQTEAQVTANGASIPEGGNAPQPTCVHVPYKTIRTNVDSADYAANSDKLDDKDSSYYLNYNNLNNKPTIPTVNNGKLTITVNGTNTEFTANQSGNTTLTLAKIASTGSYNDLSDKPNIPNVSDFVSATKNTGISVAGNTKDTYTYNKTTIFASNGLIMGGNALSAGLVTRGICGTGVPDSTTGACNKDSLYLNYDGNDTWNPSERGVVINAGSTGTDLGNGMYSYCAVRGDIVKAWVEAKGYITSHQDISGKVNRSGDTMTGKLTIQSGDASGCLQIGADATSNTLTANTRKLARVTFPTKEYGATKTCSIMSCDNLNGYNYIEFGGHVGDVTNTAPDFLYFIVDKTHNSLKTDTKECVMAISPTSLNLFSGAVDAGHITSLNSLSSKWVFNNSNTFKNSGYTYTLPSATGTIALTSNIPTALKNPYALTFGSKTYDGSSAQTITLADLGGQAAGNYVTTNTVQTIEAVKTFSAQPIISTANGLKFDSGNCKLRIYNTSASPTDYATIEVRSNSSTKRNLFIDLDINSLVVGAVSGTPDNTYKVNVKDSFNATSIYENGTSLSDKYAAKDHNHDDVYIKYNVAQSLNDTQKAQARANIGAGTSNFSGNYNDLTNKPDGTNFNNVLISRVSSLPTASATSADFVEVSKVLYIKQSTGSSSYAYTPVNTQVVRLL